MVYLFGKTQGKVPNHTVISHHCFLACDCNEEGSVSIDGERSCDIETGQCTCKENITGRTCDRSADTFWGHPNPKGNYCSHVLLFNICSRRRFWSVGAHRGGKPTFKFVLKFDMFGYYRT